MRAWKRTHASTPLPCPHGACSPDRTRHLHRHGPTHTVSTPEHAAASHAAASPWKARSRKRKRVRGMGGWHQVSTPPGRRPPPYPHPRLHSHPRPCPCPRARPCRHPGCAARCGHDRRAGRLMAAARRRPLRNPNPYGHAGIAPAWVLTRWQASSCSCSCSCVRKPTHAQM